MQVVQILLKIMMVELINNEYFFIKSGGSNTHPITNISGTTINISNNNTSPNFKSGEITNLTFKRDIDSTEINWTVNNSKSPQFSYTIELYNNSDRWHPYYFL